MNSKLDKSKDSPLLPIERKCKIGILPKAIFLIVVVILIVSSISTYVIFQLSYQALKIEIENKLMVISSNAAVLLDAEELKKIKSAEDENGQAYLLQLKRLSEIKEASMGWIKYIYTFTKVGDKVVYILDQPSENKNEFTASVGDEFPIDEFPDAAKGFLEPTAEKTLTFDKEMGIWSQSGYAPIKDNEGNVIGVVGVDMDITTLQQELTDIRNAGYIAVIVSILLAVFVGTFFAKYVTKSILTLTKFTKGVAEGNFDLQVNLKRNDEIGELATSLNIMTRDLKESREALKRYNTQLEEKVVARTSELLKSNKEVKDILDNMSQAIFTIDHDLKINPQHSRFAGTIFGDRTFAESSLLDLILPNEDQSALRESMTVWFNRIFEKTDLLWKDIEPLQPVKEISIRVRNAESHELIKHIQIDFMPIYENTVQGSKDQVNRLMVIIQDITKKKTLELHIEKKEREYKENINQIIEVINMDEELFRDFIAECKDSLIDFEPKLLALKGDKDNIVLNNELLRIMHTIKGNAKIFNLERIADEAHQIEEIFINIRKGHLVMSDDVLDDIFTKLDCFNGLFNETVEIHEKIIAGRNMDKVKIQAIEKFNEENEVIRVKILKINKLADLIKRAEAMIRSNETTSNMSNLGVEKIGALENILKETNEQVRLISKISLSRVFARFPRMIRDMALELDKKAVLLVEGENIEVDKKIFDHIWDPLMHILRNSIDHGIETPQERIRLGKPEEGLIAIKVNQIEKELTIEIRDDGKGIDIDRLKANAVKKGLITPQNALYMSNEEAIKLIFMPGLSSNDEVTEISGRGIGMDVVRVSVEECLNGTIQLNSKKDMGFSIIFTIPL